MLALCEEVSLSHPYETILFYLRINLHPRSSSVLILDPRYYSDLFPEFLLPDFSLMEYRGLIAVGKNRRVLYCGK